MLYQNNISDKSIVEMLVTIEHTIDEIAYLSYEGIELWPIIRLILWQKLVHSNYEVPKKNSFKNLKFPLYTLSQSQNAELNKYRICDILFFSKWNEHAVQKDNAFFNVHIDPIIAYLKDYKYFKIELATNQSKQTFPRFINTYLLNPEMRVNTVNIENGINNFIDIQKQIQDITGITVDEYEIIKSIYDTIAWELFFSNILSIIHPKALFLVFFGYNTGMGLIRACKKKDIIIVDIQHGVQGDYHPYYTRWTTITHKSKICSILPDYCWCWGESTKRNMDQWMNPKDIPIIKTVVGGYPRLSLWKNKEDFIINDRMRNFYKFIEQKQKVILVSLSHEQLPIPEHVFSAMSMVRNKNWIWLFRLHPNHRSQSMVKQIELLSKKYQVNNLEIECATFFPLFGLLKRSHHHVSLCSSVFYEAFAFEVETTMIHPISITLFENDYKKSLFRYADTAESLIDSIQMEKRNHLDYTFFVQTDKNITMDSIDTILSRKIVSQYNSELHYVRALNELGVNVLNNGHKRAAIKILLKAYDMNTMSAIVANNIGIIYTQLGEAINAAHFFVAALEKAQNNNMIIKNVTILLKLLTGEVDSNEALQILL